MKKTVVAMSGGVDSSVCAVMMKQSGFETIGVTLQLHDDSSCKTGKTCCASRDIYDAARICETFDIPHYVLNYEDIFRQEVIEKFCDQYLAGATPIPCITCNQTVKFRDLYKIAKDYGAESLVTGHYVQKIQGKYGAELHMGQDITKDQSYFLYQTTKEQLEFLEFPLGAMTKLETRALAENMGLKIANKPDSQNICFVPNGDYAKVIEKFRPGSLTSGNIVDAITGKILGEHKGIINFTVGQRRGVGVGGFETPIYVIRLDVSTNTVYVGPEELLFKEEFRVQSWHFLLHQDEDMPQNLSVRVRSSSVSISCKIDGTNVVLLEKTKLIASGQAAVLYDGTRVIGGSIII